jgi:hypothetical protein
LADLYRLLPKHIVTGKGIELAKLLPELFDRSLELLPGHIVTGKGIELAKLLPIGRSLELLPGHIVTGRGICRVGQIAARINWHIFKADARTYCCWQDKVGQIAARLNWHCCQDILLLARE